MKTIIAFCLAFVTSVALAKADTTVYSGPNVTLDTQLQQSLVKQLQDAQLVAHGIESERLEVTVYFDANGYLILEEIRGTNDYLIDFVLQRLSTMQLKGGANLAGQKVAFALLFKTI